MVLRPQDARRINQQRDIIFRNTGFNIQWRRATNQAGGAPEFGIEDSQNYVTRTINVLIQTAGLQDVQQMGGTIVEGALICQARERPGPKDMFTWDGGLYEVASETTPVKIGNATWYRFALQRAS